MLRYEEETMRQYESNERLQNTIREMQHFNSHQLIEENKTLKKILLDTEDKLREQEDMWTEKVKYLKRDINMKEL